MKEYEIGVVDLVRIIWKRKWLIGIPTLVCILAAVAVSFSLPETWEIDAVFHPGRLSYLNESGKQVELDLVDFNPLLGQIKSGEFIPYIARETGQNFAEIPPLQAERITRTQQVRLFLREKDVEKGKVILAALLERLKGDMDRRLDAELKKIDDKLIAFDKEVAKKEAQIQSLESELKAVRQDLLATERRLAASLEQEKSISGEIQAVKQRLDRLHELQIDAWERKEGREQELALLVVSNEILANSIHFTSLSDRLRHEKNMQENFEQRIADRKGRIKLVESQLEQLRDEREQMIRKRETLEERKHDVTYARVLKEPGPLPYPVAPRKKVIVGLAAALSFLLFTFLAFSLEFWKIRNRDGEKPS